MLAVNGSDAVQIRFHSTMQLSGSCKAAVRQSLNPCKQLRRRTDLESAHNQAFGCFGAQSRFFGSSRDGSDFSDVSAEYSPRPSQRRHAANLTRMLRGRQPGKQRLLHSSLTERRALSAQLRRNFLSKSLNRPYRPSVPRVSGGVVQTTPLVSYKADGRKRAQRVGPAPASPGSSGVTVYSAARPGSTFVVNGVSAQELPTTAVSPPSPSPRPVFSSLDETADVDEQSQALLDALNQLTGSSAGHTQQLQRCMYENHHLPLVHGSTHPCALQVPPSIPHISEASAPFAARVGSISDSASTSPSRDNSSRTAVQEDACAAEAAAKKADAQEGQSEPLGEPVVYARDPLSTDIASHMLRLSLQPRADMNKVATSTPSPGASTSSPSAGQAPQKAAASTAGLTIGAHRPITDRRAWVHAASTAEAAAATPASTPSIADGPVTSAAEAAEMLSECRRAASRDALILSMRCHDFQDYLSHSTRRPSIVFDVCRMARQVRPLATTPESGAPAATAVAPPSAAPTPEDVVDTCAGVGEDEGNLDFRDILSDMVRADDVLLAEQEAAAEAAAKRSVNWHSGTGTAELWMSVADASGLAPCPIPRVKHRSDE